MSDSVDDEIAKVEECLAKAKTEKETADSTFIALDTRLSALRNLKRDSDKATEAYAAAHDALKITQQNFQDYLDPEIDNLETRLGAKGVAAVTDLVTAKRALDAEQKKVADDAQTAVTVAQDAKKKAEDDRTAKAAVADEYKQLPVVIEAKHATLKAIRDEVLKARQAGKYALAYWLLTRPGFKEALAAGDHALVAPAALPKLLSDAVDALTTAEVALADKDQLLGKARTALAEAQKAEAEQKAKGEAVLREQLAAVVPAPDPDPPDPYPAAVPAAGVAPAPAATARSDEENT